MVGIDLHLHLKPGDAVKFGKDWMAFTVLSGADLDWASGWNLDSNGEYQIICIPINRITQICRDTLTIYKSSKATYCFER